jgi:hypothetical protein
MLHVVKGATRLAAAMLVMGVSSAFGALYTFDLTSATRVVSTVGGGFIVGSVEDAAVTITLTALAGSQSTASIVVRNTEGAGVDDGQGGGSVGEDNVEGGAGAETLVITPNATGPFTLSAVTFTNTETTGGGDDATIFLDQYATEFADIPIGDASGTFTYNAPSNTFTTFVAFENSDGNDDFEISQIVLDIETAAVPEPSTWTLLGLGAGALAWFRRRRA